MDHYTTVDVDALLNALPDKMANYYQAIAKTGEILMINAENLDQVDSDSATLTKHSDDFWRLSVSRISNQEIILSKGILSPLNGTLSGLISGRRALFVVTPSVDRIYGRALRKYIKAVDMNAECEVVVLNSNEATKNLQAVSELCDRASNFGLGRNAPIIAMGGGVCLDITGLSAALYRRGVPNIKVPTTLIGLIDAGIGTKNAVNHRSHKSLIGTFSAPAASVLDSTFLATLPDRHLRNGFAEMLKIAVIADKALFEMLREQGGELLQERFQDNILGAHESIRRSVVAMLEELSLNLYETEEYRRKVDFGHTFSPYIETASKHAVLHGEAVAIDIAISTQIAYNLDILSIDERDAVLEALRNSGLSCHWNGLDASDMYLSLQSIRQHRNGNLHLVVPDAIGSCVFLEDNDIDLRLLRTSVNQLSSGMN
jgi:2-epi-5-epi-valiolone synthase